MKLSLSCLTKKYFVYGLIVPILKMNDLHTSGRICNGFQITFEITRRTEIYEIARKITIE